MNCLIDVIIYKKKILADINNFVQELLQMQLGEEFKIIIIGRLSEEILHLSQKFINQIHVIEIEDENSFSIENEIKKSENDVLIVLEPFAFGKEWFWKLKSYAYAREEFATASPIDINYIYESTIGNDLVFKTASKVKLEQYSYIQAPASSCFYFKRSVLDELISSNLVIFDENYAKHMFQVASEFGYRHVICEDVVVISEFKANKNYNDIPNVHKDNLLLHLKLRPNRKNFLYVLHTGIRSFDQNSLGGVQKHVSDLVDFFKNQYNSFVAWYENKEVKVVAFCGDEEIEFSFPLLSNIEENIYRDYDTYLIFDKIIKAFSIDIVHVHHIKSLNFEVFYAAKDNNIPIILTLHDYYFICPKIFLINERMKHCELNDNKDCRKCLKSRGYKVDFAQKRRIEFKKIIDFCKSIIVPDRSVYEKYAHIMGDFDVEVIPNGICYKDNDHHDESMIKEDKYFNIAFIGQMSTIKGSSIVVDLIKNDNSDSIKWHFFGPICDMKLDILKNSNIIKHGRYRSTDIVDLIKANNIDVACIPSQAPETFCYTLSEAWMAGIPVIASDIGALGNRIKGNGGGILVPKYNRWEAYLEVIYKLNNDRELLRKLKEQLKYINVTTVDEMGRTYNNVYSNFITRTLNSTKNNVDNKLVYNAYKQKKISLISEDNQRITMLEQYKEELFEIKNSFQYKIFARIFKLIKPYEKKVILISRKLLSMLTKF